MQIQTSNTTLKRYLRGGILSPSVPKPDAFVKVTRDDIRRWGNRSKAGIGSLVQREDESNYFVNRMLQSWTLCLRPKMLKRFTMKKGLAKLTGIALLLQKRRPATKFSAEFI